MKNFIFYVILGVNITFLITNCAEVNKERAEESILSGTTDGSGRQKLELSALDIDIKEAFQNEDQSLITFNIVVSVDNDLCDLIDLEVEYQFMYEANHPDSDFAGKIFTYIADFGRLKKGHTETKEIERGTNGPVAIDSIKVKEAWIRDLQNCTIDPFRPD